MFSYTKKEIIILAQELNVQKQTLERVLRLIDVLEFINADIFLKDKLVLKGGTAINLTFYDYLRFKSIDALCSKSPSIVAFILGNVV